MISILFVSVISSSANASNNNSGDYSGIRTGLRTAFQPNLWDKNRGVSEGGNKYKWRVINSNMSLYEKIGAGTNVIYVRQGLDGKDGYDRIKDIIELHKKYGIKTMIRLIADPATYFNLDADENSKYGYNKEYYEWVSNIVNLTKLSSVYYLVGNELERDILHNTFPKKEYQKKYGEKLPINFSDYQKLFTTARKAIKDIDASLQVVDHSPGSSTHGLAVAYDLYKEKGFDIAYHFWVDYRSGYEIPLNDKSVFKRLMENPKTIKRIEFARRVYTDLIGVDAFQLHHYRSWTSIQTILDWVRKHMEKSPEGVRPIIATEVGRFYKSGINEAAKNDRSIVRDFPQEENVEYLVKNMTILAANGVQEIVSWGFRKWHDASNVIHLFNTPQKQPEEVLPHLPAHAFCAFSKLLGGKKPSASSGYIGDSDVTEYRFTNSDGDISVIWADKPLKSMLKKQPAYIISATGKGINQNSNGLLAVDKNPIYLLWKGNPPLCAF